MKLLKINRLNEIYDSLSEKTDMQFFEQAIQELGIRYECGQKSIKNIPETGPFIVIANHPYGGIDGLLLLKIIVAKRPDIKFFGNFLLQKIKPIESYIFPGNPFENHSDYSSSIAGIKQALIHLENGGCLGIFPAGEVSSLNIGKQRITDTKWSNSIIKFIIKANVPILPIHISGRNSRLFQTLRLIHPELRTIKLPSELFNKKEKLITLTIGSLISREDQSGFSDIEQFGRFLRVMTYLPSMAFHVKSHFASLIQPKNKVFQIAQAVEKTAIKNELENLRSKYFLFNHLTISAFCAPYAEIPNIMTEIGRLREITFREVGEGTNMSIDLDEYDLYYWHLFLWDNATETIVGAYRIGKGKEIFNQFTYKGFYTHSLFKFKKEFHPILKQSIELGRSFIVKEYQRKPLPLFLLWKGILYFLNNNPGYRYLIGPVSISNDYSQFSRGLIMKFIQKFYSDPEFFKLVKPRKKYMVNDSKGGFEILINSTNGDFRKLEKIISIAEKKTMLIPVLLKKYLQLNGRILNFNLDPKFNNSLDGFILLDLYTMPAEFVLSLSKDIQELKADFQTGFHKIEI